MAPGLVQVQVIIASRRLPAPSVLASIKYGVLPPSQAASITTLKRIVVAALAPPPALSVRFIPRSRVGVVAGIIGLDLLPRVSSIRLLRHDLRRSTRSSTSTVHILGRARRCERHRRGGHQWTNRLCLRPGEQVSPRPDQAMPQARHQHSSLRRGKARSPVPAAPEEVSEGRAGRSLGAWSRRDGRHG